MGTAWIPEYLQEDTQDLLREEMRLKHSAADVSGYIYAFEIDGEPPSPLPNPPSPPRPKGKNQKKKNHTEPQA